MIRNVFVSFCIFLSSTIFNQATTKYIRQYNTEQVTVNIAIAL